MHDHTADHHAALAHLDDALEQILAARAALGLPDAPPLPVDGLEAALADSEQHQEARQASAAAMEALRAVLAPEHVQLLLRVEECLRAEGVSATDAVWRLSQVATGEKISGR